ncbi:fumarylacetoacetate hydrolase family protein [Priestia koreensis]|uniref:fumarylacetoacetate hydrolase family protein n=1 Tax=Priestia koreensis TaxID=284581 RepID=UPI001F582D79|nr:fumarylacetoacetate hydrolase family protein [Priestia koreensis]UNL83313.1 fumarylacetoacetate hydrolase family protein [Priestia koreensis]
MKNIRIKLAGSPTLKEASIHQDFHSITLSTQTIQLENLICDPPVHGTVYGALLNYKGELEALGDQVHNAPYQKPPVAPVLYIKPVNTLSGMHHPIPLPADTTHLSVGAALAVVFKETASNVTEQKALDYVLGYTIANDVSIPHDTYFRPAIKQKARDGFCPMGPYIMLKEHVKDPDHLAVRVFVNGELKQENTTANLIRSVSKLISDVSSFMTFYKGDVLLIGVPENKPIVQNGDVVRIELDGIGYLENVVQLEEVKG